MNIQSIEEIQPGEATDLCNRVAAALRIAAGHEANDRDAWERLARTLAKRFDDMKADLDSYRRTANQLAERVAAAESRADAALRSPFNE